MPRGKRKTTVQRFLDRALWQWRYWTDLHFAARSDGARKAAVTRKARRSVKIGSTPE